MNRFFEPLPTTVEHNHRIIKLTPAYDNVLMMYDALTDPLTDMERLDIMLYYLTKKAPRDVELLVKVVDLLFPRRDKQTDGHRRAFDFIQDADLIYAAFYQVYGIDLIEAQGKLHWLKFNALLNGLPQGTRFGDIIQIRLRDVPAPTKHNAKERAELMRLKREFALKISDDERRENMQAGLKKIALALHSMAKQG